MLAAVRRGSRRRDPGRGGGPARAGAAAGRLRRAGLARPGSAGVRGDAGVRGGRVLGQSRVGRRDVPVRLAEHAQHPLHLAQRLTAHRLDRAQRGPGLGGLAVEHVLAEAGLHGDHRHAVRHDVVQFPGDPEPFPGDRVGGRPVPQVRDVGPPLLHQVPDHPEDGEDQPGGGRVPGPQPVEVQHHALRDQQAQRAGQAGQRDPPAAGGRDQVQHHRQRQERAAGDLLADDQGDQAAGQHDGQGPDRHPAPDRDRDGQAEGQHGQQGIPGGQHPAQGPGPARGMDHQETKHEHGEERRGRVVQPCPEPPPQPRAPRRSGCSAHQLTVTPQGTSGRPPAVVRCRSDPGHVAAQVRPGPEGESHSPG